MDGSRRIQTEIGQGSAGAGGVSLAQAREKADEHRRARAAGENPLTRKHANDAAVRVAGLTFGSFADDYVRSHKAGWSNKKHADQWAMTLGPAYCKTIRAKSIATIDVDDILAVLTPVWQEKPETARRIRMRLEKVLDAAKVKGLRSGDNPARWKGHLDHLLPRHGKLSKSHHAAMPFPDVPAFLAELSGRTSTASLALAFLILTATRTSETLGAQWREIDLDHRLWTIPGERMKSRRLHRIPLSDAALDILRKTRGLNETWVFPGPSLLTPLSNMSLLMQLRRMGRTGVTAHGFRSSFRDWAAETTSFPREVAEMALAHTITNDTEAAYRRGDLFDKRRSMMEAWAVFCSEAKG
jgi:integrase